MIHDEEEAPSSYEARLSRLRQHHKLPEFELICWTRMLVRPVSNVVLLPCRTQMNLARQWHDDSTAAVSSVEPNKVAPNSKDKTNHPSSDISPFKMAEGILSEDREKFALFKTILNARNHRKWMQQSILNTVIARRRLLLQVSSFIFPLVSFHESQQQAAALRSCRRF